MNSVTALGIDSNSSADTLALASTLARKLRGGEVIELVGDLGAGKTELARGLARGIGSKDVVQSPTFTINRIYKGPKVIVHHYDFHRLEDPGILREQLQESLNSPGAVIVVEWSDSVRDVLPEERLTISIKAKGETARVLSFQPRGKIYEKLVAGLQ